MQEDKAMAEEKVIVRRADSSAAGLAAFAVTTFLVSLYNLVGGSNMPLPALFLVAAFYGGLAQFVAGLFAYRREDGFAATVFMSYGALYLLLAAMGGLLLRGTLTPGIALSWGLAWILLAYAVINLGFLLQSIWVNATVSLLMLGIEVTEILLVIGYFRGEAAGVGIVTAAGVVGIITAIVAWYAGVASLVNGMAGGEVLPMGHASAWTPREHRLFPIHRAA